MKILSTSGAENGCLDDQKKKKKTIEPQPNNIPHDSHHT